jgi:hypothetical protein
VCFICTSAGVYAVEADIGYCKRCWFERSQGAAHELVDVFGGHCANCGQHESAHRAPHSGWGDCPPEGREEPLPPERASYEDYTSWRYAQERWYAALDDYFASGPGTCFAPIVGPLDGLDSDF